MEWTNIIPWGISLAMFIIALVSFFKNGKKDLKEEQREENSQFAGIRESLLKVNLKLDQVCATTNDTRADIKAMNAKINDFERRVAVIENDLKNVWERLDELKK